MKLIRRIPLHNVLLLIVALALLFDIYLLRRRQARILDALAFYRQPTTEGIYDALDQPLATMYPDGATLEVVLKEIKARTTGKPKLASGIPIYVDPVGLQEAQQTMTSPIKRPESAERVTLGEQLRAVLEPLGLNYQVRQGFLMITSQETVDNPVGVREEPYAKFRDVLR